MESVHVYQIVASYEDTNDADRLRHDPLLQIVADEKLGNALGSQPTLSRWENSACAESRDSQTAQRHWDRHDEICHGSR